MRHDTSDQEMFGAGSVFTKERLEALGVAKTRKARLADLGVVRSRRPASGYGPLERNPGRI